MGCQGRVSAVSSDFRRTEAAIATLTCSCRMCAEVVYICRIDLQSPTASPSFVPLALAHETPCLSAEGVFYRREVGPPVPSSPCSQCSSAILALNRAQAAGVGRFFMHQLPSVCGTDNSLECACVIMCLVDFELNPAVCCCPAGCATPHVVQKGLLGSSPASPHHR
jgi:hypothetical protein